MWTDQPPGLGAGGIAWASQVSQAGWLGGRLVPRVGLRRHGAVGDGGARGLFAGGGPVVAPGTGRATAGRRRRVWWENAAALGGRRQPKWAAAANQVNFT